ncbi:TPA: mechanosensitive ion channel family protein [Candidatus Woesearchaeota archaeon]|nr:mechanosensitive ion channel family protein [Candidatus Woesearchaeota archaeon]
MTFWDSAVQFALSPSFIFLHRILVILFILLGSFALSVLFNYLMKRSFERMMKKRYEPGHKPDTTKFVVLRRLISVLIYLVGFAAIIYVIPEFRAVSYSILAGAGVFAIIIGFAAQNALGNILSGVFLATSQPIRVGDRILIDEIKGIVEDITLRHVIIRSWDNQHIIIPNSKVNESKITNYTIEGEEFIQTMDLGISYDSDIDLAKKIIMEEVQKHPDFIIYGVDRPMLTQEERVRVRVTEAGDFAMHLRAYFWAKDTMTGFKMMCDVLENVKKRFDSEGVEIPFPYRTLVYKKDLKKPKKHKEKKG